MAVLRRLTRCHNVIAEPARAKVNLTLHVGRRIEDRSDAFFRYHPIDSLVVFAEVGDYISAKESDKTSLRITGPFANGLPRDETNHILKAYQAVQREANLPNLAFHLEKNLPVAAGVGGGSANAAATLRILKAYANLPDAKWHCIALGIGADVPVCLGSKTSWMTGIGESISPVPGLGTHPAVLVNPRVAVSTLDVYDAYDKGAPPDTPALQSKHGDLLERARAGTNNLQPVSEALATVISDVIRALDFRRGCELARMTGSGASCFGLFDTDEDALNAAHQIQSAHPDWWSIMTRLGDPE